MAREAATKKKAPATKKTTPATKKKAPAKALAVPTDLERALVGAPRARAVFEGYSPSHRREYVAWIEEARRPETRARRIAQTIARLDEV